MPQRIHLTELQGGTVGGVPIVVSMARGGELVAFAATYDQDGLMESMDDCRRFALRFREKLDKAKQSGKDIN